MREVFINFKLKNLITTSELLLMGGYLTKSYELVNSQSLLGQVKHLTIKDILECYTVFSQDYHCHYVDCEQFTDIFGLIIDDPSEYFVLLQNDHDVNGTVDIYETFSVFMILSGDSIDSKIPFVFKLFDFDCTGSLEMSELHMTLQSAARGISKFVGIAPPSHQDIEVMTQNIFEDMDIDHNNRVVPQEFVIWVNNNIELQEFLLKSTGKLTREYAIKRLVNIGCELEHFFIKATSNSDAQYVSEESLRNVLIKSAKAYVNPNQIDLMLNVLRDTTTDSGQNSSDKSMISKDAYETLIRAWSAFSALDYYNQDKLTKNELKTLIWIYEGKEPSEGKITAEMEEIDKDHSGYISRDEWITNFCSAENDGRMAFKKNLRELFEKVDADGSGEISHEELRVLSAEAFEDYIRITTDKEKRKLLQGMIDSLAEEIFAELNADKNDKIEWHEFKNYMNVATKKYQKLRDFLVTNFKQA